ncbi:MAG: RNA 3'-phosphate cyclase [Candidatus Latescibacteria bacterium]|nr:RNA 3'-phosphate cyclase [Candidatus Latescibacterota bacterium]
MICIDGSYGEGGGQILRTSLALSAILRQPLQVDRIRAGRKRPGLMAQHLTGVQAIARICGGMVEGAELHSGKIVFHPGEIRAGKYEFDVARVKASAGSTGMIFLTIAPPLSFAEEKSSLVLKGGTHARWAPPIDYLSDIFLPTVRRMGFEARIATERWGWYPEGGGIVRAEIVPRTSLEGITLEDRGALEAITGLSVVSNLPRSIAERQRNQALKRLRGKGLEADISLLEAPFTGTGTFFFLTAHFEHIVAGFSGLGARGKRAEKVADEAVNELFAYLQNGDAVDPYLADQLILYMALARGPSSFTTSQISRHLLTNVWVVEQFLPVKFQVQGRLGEPGRVRVEGIGLLSS